MAWKKGPMPKGTYGWGGIVKTSQERDSRGFYLADFCGDSVKLTDGEVVEADQVAMYDNSIELPPKEL